MARNCKDWLKAYVHFTRASESPDKFHFWTGVSTIAGALGRRVWLPEGYFQWLPNFYIILVGPPGVAAKSTSMRMGMSLLEDLKIPLGPESGTWQKVTASLKDSMKEVKYIDWDGSAKKTVMCALTMAISELGTFLTPEDDRQIQIWTDLWDGKTGTWGHHTITGGQIDIKNPSVNLIACTTPSWLRTNFPEAAIGGGLTSRVVFVYGENKRRYIAYPSDEVNGPEFDKERKDLFWDLAEISTISGPMLRTPEASEWGRKWYWDHWHKPRPVNLVGERYDGYYARKQTHLHKLAMIMSVAKRSTRMIELTDMIEAHDILAGVEADMNKAFKSIGLVDEARRTEEIMSYVRDMGLITTMDLWLMCSRSMSQRDFREALASAMTSMMLVSCWKDGKPAVKKP